MFFAAAGAGGQDDIDRYTATTAEGRALVGKGERTSARYALSKFRLSRRGSLFGTSIARSLEAFYARIAGAGGRAVGRRFRGPRSGCVPANRASRQPSATGVGSDPKHCRSLTLPARQDPDSLVLGGTGFIGRALVRRLVDAGRSVRLLVRDPAGLPKSLRDLPLDLVRGDLSRTRSQSIERWPAFTTCLHLARGSGKTYDDYVRSDLEPTEIVAAACLKPRHPSARSTPARSTRSTPAGRYTIDDATPLDPRIHRRNPYARVKADAEQRLLELHAARKLPVVILRPGVVVGVGASPFHWGVAWWPGPFVCRFWGRGDEPAAAGAGR